MNIINTIKNVVKPITHNAKFAKFAFKVKKHAPTIAVIGGSIGTVGAFAWGIKKTLNFDVVLDEINNDIHEAKAVDSSIPGVARAYVKGAWKITKFYAGPILVEGASVAFILWGYNILDGRLVAMTATAASMETLNKNQKNYMIAYRDALKERYGENFDDNLEVKYAQYLPECGSPKLTAKYIDENGEEQEVEVDRVIDECDHRIGHNIGDMGLSPYAVIFDETSTEWQNDPEYNKFTLQRIRQTCNDLLHANGHLFLNEVYHELGLPATRVGQMVGWLANGDGDGYVDFGIYNVGVVPNRSEFVNGFEPSVILDFNVDGMIWDKI